MHNKKKSTLETKTAIMAGSINAVTKAQKKKIDNSKLDMSLPKVNYSDVYVYLKKNWQHRGKSCMLCNKMMNDSYVIENHHYVCEQNILKHRKLGTD